MATSKRDAEPRQAADGPAPALRCDFCGEASTSLRRIALDRGYDRLQMPHHEQYACAACSEKKEKRRLGIERG
jgi:hypothetical protein